MRSDNLATLPVTSRDIRGSLLKLAEHVFRPLNRMFLRHNILIPELQRILRWSGARVAICEPEFAVDGRSAYTQTVSHAAVITGMTRGEINKALLQNAVPVTPDGDRVHRLIRILAAWKTEPGYQDAYGEPLPLAVRGAAPSVEDLCSRHGRDTPARAVADILVKNGNAEWDNADGPRKNGGRLRFVSSVARADNFSMEDALVLTQIAADFAHSLQESFDPGVEPQPRLVELYFNDIDADREREAFDYLRREVDAFIETCQRGLKKFRTRDDGKGIRMGVALNTFRRAPWVLDDVADKGKHASEKRENNT